MLIFAIYIYLLIWWGCYIGVSELDKEKKFWQCLWFSFLWPALLGGLFVMLFQAIDTYETTAQNKADHSG